MKQPFKIVTPTYKRAGRVRATEIFGRDLILAVHEFEVEEYQKHHVNPIMILPDSIRGNMGKVRNFIRENAESYWVVMVDDDVYELGYHEDMKQIPMTKEQIYHFIYMRFILCEDLGTVLWGLNMSEDPKWYREYSPFSLLSPVLGTFSCHIVRPDGLRYDERFGLTEDYDFSLLVLHRYHKLLRDNKHYYNAGHLTEPGGCGSYRLKDEEVRQLVLFQRKWGREIVTFDISKSTNARVRCPLKGI